MKTEVADNLIFHIKQELLTQTDETKRMILFDQLEELLAYKAHLREEELFNKLDEEERLSGKEYDV